MYNTNSMLDFSKIFNIVFVSVCVALLLLLLISVIVVAAKGKRKAGVGDVLLRIVSALVLVVSTVMVACAVLAMLSQDGSMYIAIAEKDGVAAAVLVMGGKITELPIPELFVALSTVIGFGLSAVLFILSLTTLIVDCLVANKKDDKKQKAGKDTAVKKTPEQIKREKELERIRRIGESAVRKTSSVASAEKAEKTETPAADNKTTDNAQEYPETPEEDDFDWRTAPSEPKKEQAGFVGIKEDESDSFDSFDTFDEPAQDGEAQSQEEEQDYAEESVDEQAYADEEGAEEAREEIYYDDDEKYTLDDTAEESEAYAEPQEEVIDNSTIEEEQAYDEPIVEQAHENEEQPINAVEKDGNEIEPDRGIYIPKIRTVTPKQKPEVKKATAKKPTARKPASKPAKPKKSGSGSEQKPAVATNIPPEKKLPVTRRYVILDRHNAVNMFGEYLKERNQAEKDKLTSSINTIIIE